MLGLRFHYLVHLDRSVQEKNLGVGVSFYVINIVIEQAGNLCNLLKIKYFSHVLSRGKFFGSEAHGRASGADQGEHFPQKM